MGIGTVIFLPITSRVNGQGIKSGSGNSHQGDDRCGVDDETFGVSEKVDRTNGYSRLWRFFDKSVLRTLELISPHNKAALLGQYWGQHRSTRSPFSSRRRHDTECTYIGVSLYASNNVPSYG